MGARVHRARLRIGRAWHLQHFLKLIVGFLLNSLGLLELGDKIHLDTLEFLNVSLLVSSLLVLISDTVHVGLSNIVLALRLIVVES
jgi:hypothetical protein